MIDTHAFDMLQLYVDKKVAGNFVINKIFRENHNQDETNKAHQFLIDRGYIKQQPNQIGRPSEEGYFFEITEAGMRAYLDDRWQQIFDQTKEDLERSILLNQDRILRSQLQLNPIIRSANESTIVTNEHTRSANNRLIVIFGVTALFSLLGFGVAALTYNLELTKYGEDKLLRQAQSTISQLNSSLQEKDVQLGLRKKTIDSLVKIVFVAKPLIMAGGK